LVVYKNTDLWGQRCVSLKIILFSRPAICNFIRALLAVIRFTFIASGLNLITGRKRFILDFNVVSINSVEFNFIIIIDYISLMFMGVVTLIASCVVYYSKDYMAGDANIERFIWLVFIFVISIIALIISPNLIRILLGWDGLGLVSYALVIYYQNIKSFNAGILTALSNRIGDVIILISIALMSSSGRFNFIHMDTFTTPFWGLTVIFITVAAYTKSAQIPFSA
jgi:NADH-ubiquinone oxidoreductase chain 5